MIQYNNISQEVGGTLIGEDRLVVNGWSGIGGMVSNSSFHLLRSSHYYVLSSPGTVSSCLLWFSFIFRCVWLVTQLNVQLGNSLSLSLPLCFSWRGAMVTCSVCTSDHSLPVVVLNGLEAVCEALVTCTAEFSGRPNHLMISDITECTGTVFFNP
jgi:hypothetical protein